MRGNYLKTCWSGGWQRRGHGLRVRIASWLLAIVVASSAHLAFGATLAADLGGNATWSVQAYLPVFITAATPAPTTCTYVGQIQGFALPSAAAQYYFEYAGGSPFGGTNSAASAGSLACEVTFWPASQAQPAATCSGAQTMFLPASMTAGEYLSVIIGSSEVGTIGSVGRYAGGQVIDAQLACVGSTTSVSFSNNPTIFALPTGS